jgi:hypothetical protein
MLQKKKGRAIRIQKPIFFSIAPTAAAASPFLLARRAPPLLPFIYFCAEKASISALGLFLTPRGNFLMFSS